MSGARSVTATFPLLNRTLSVTKAGQGTVTSSPGGISCGGTCQAQYPAGTEVILSGAPASGYEAPTWTGCGSVDGEDRCHVTMSVSKSVSAAFDSTTRTLSVAKSGEGAPFASVQSSPAGIACGASCSAPFAKSSQVTLTAALPPHGKAVVWSGCDSVLSGQCKVTMSAAKSVGAKFDLQSGYSLVTLTVARSGTGQGTVSGSGGISCGGVCSAQFISTSEVSLSAAPSSGSVFSHWSGGGCKGSGPCTTTVRRATTVKAVFSLAGARTLTVAKAGTGSGTVKGSKASGIDCGQTCSAQVKVGKTVSLTPRPAKGSAFAGWSGCSAVTKNTCKVKMTEAKSVTATFTAPPAAASPAAACLVPKLRGKTLKRAKRALKRAHCKLGKVRRPKARKGRKRPRLVVRSSKPGAGTKLGAGAKVGVKLRVAKGKKKR
jgi:hypothetical protein